MGEARGRSVLITGCSSGIGLDSARALQARGWRVLATCRAAEDAARLEAEGLESFALDLACADSVAAGAAEALARTGDRLDAVFNNGAYAIPGAAEDLPRDALRAIFETNFFGQVDLTNRLLPAMRRAGAGRVVMNSSVLGLMATPWRAAYVATKYALEGFTDTLRLELRGSGVQVSLIEPGPIATPFRRKAIPHFERWIDWRASPHAARYESVLLKRLYAPEGAKKDRFQLPPSAVTEKLVHALESARPAARYYVTRSTWIAEGMRRFLPTGLRDAVAARL